MFASTEAAWRQAASDAHLGKSKLREEPLEMVFIRAPIIESAGKDVEILAVDAGHPVMVRQGRILASTFHPELTRDTATHEYFAAIAWDSPDRDCAVMNDAHPFCNPPAPSPQKM